MSYFTFLSRSARSVADSLQSEARPGAGALLHRYLIVPGWLVLAGAVLLDQLLPFLPGWVRYAPFVLSMVLFGLPHGATDHLVPRRLQPRHAARRRQLLFYVGYLSVAGAYVFVWYVAPLAAALFFLLLTWFHWGQGDLHAVHRQLGGTYLRSRGLRVLALLLRGALPMVVPLAAFPGSYRATIETLAGLFTPNVASAWIEAPVVPAGAAAVVALLVTAYAIGTRRAARNSRERRVWRRDMLEIALLLVVFATVEPLLAIGLYFCFWHSTRHIARLMLIDPRGRRALEQGRFAPALGRFFRDAAPLSIVALGLGGALGALTPYADLSLDGLLALYLVLIAALTLPHTLVVTWMDRRQ